ncbi:hypothetical protein [Amphibacillus sediminis]|uniref:hypothetical protein n=1 Tax=Amphibacillus sediminis TaxID=360185 RepID=UPI0008310B4E|nr:hypothetical protein [Amphibacillus sediminis]
MIRLNLMQAGQLEQLRYQRMSDLDILTHIQQNPDSASELSKLDQETILQCLNHGYTIKFVTINGLKKLLQLKFQFEEGTDFSVTEKGIAQLKLTTKQVHEVEQLLSTNWKIIKDTNNSYKVELRSGEGFDA